MNTPTWYFPALADVALNCLEREAQSVIERAKTLQKVSRDILPPPLLEEYHDAVGLVELIAREKEYRQTVRLHEAAQVNQDAT